MSVDTRSLTQAVLYRPMTPDIQETANAWSALSEDIFVPHNEEKYGQVVTVLDHLVDEVGGDESHSLASLMEALSVLIERYEAEHVPELIAN